MPALSKQDLLAHKPKIESVAVPELGEGAIVYLRELTAASVVGYAALHGALEGNDSQRIPRLMDFMLARSICDEGGQRLFTDEDSPLEAMIFAVANRLWTKALELNRIEDDEKKGSETDTKSTLHAA